MVDLRVRNFVHLRLREVHANVQRLLGLLLLGRQQLLSV